MNIIVSGGGLIRLSSAYFLQKSVYNVILIEQANKVSIGTTFTNSGQFSI
jgi:L-2-hydroxyglutarate oxidase LhgO